MVETRGEYVEDSSNDQNDQTDQGEQQEELTESSQKASEEQQDSEENEQAESKSEKEEDFKAKYYYLAAEMQNLRKRFEKEKQNIIKFGSEKVVSGLIEVLDNMDRTLDALSGDDDDKVKNIVSGVEMVRDQFLNTLKQHGVERIEALGETFDPNYHEAMAQKQDEEKEDETIVEEYQKGYMLNGRLIRPAKVVVVKNENS